MITVHNNNNKMDGRPRRESVSLRRWWWFRDLKDSVYPLFESDTLFLEGVFVSFFVVERFFESRDV